LILFSQFHVIFLVIYTLVLGFTITGTFGIHSVDLTLTCFQYNTKRQDYPRKQSL